MSSDVAWSALRERCHALDPDTVLVTPDSERAFTIESTDADRIVIRFVDSDGERILWRDQFAFLHDRITDDAEPLSLRDVAPGVEPYVAVLSLSPDYAVEDAGRSIRLAREGDAGESPFVRPEWTTRSQPERVRDDALLLADWLERRDVSDPTSLEPGTLVDLYVLLSDVQHGSDRVRQSLRDDLMDRIGPDATLHGTYGTVRRTTRERRRPKDDETVLSAVDDLGIPREWVLGVDTSKLDVVLSVTDLEVDDVYDVEEQEYVQKIEVEEDEKQARLQGLRARLEALDGEDATELRTDIEEIEDRLDALLADT